MVEAQIELALKAIRYVRGKKKVAALDVKPEKARAFSDWIDEKSKNTVWLSGCRSWYLDAQGRNPTVWPLGVGAFRRRVVAFRAKDYRTTEGKSV
jgi:hypothetical protein